MPMQDGRRMNAPILSFQAVSKRFGGTQAVDLEPTDAHVRFEVNHGDGRFQ